MVASLDHPPSDGAVAWARGRLEAASADDGNTELDDGEGYTKDDTLKVFEGTKHRLCFLWRRDGIPFAVLVLASEAKAPELPSPAVLRVMGDGLAHHVV